MSITRATFRPLAARTARLQTASSTAKVATPIVKGRLNQPAFRLTPHHSPFTTTSRKMSLGAPLNLPKWLKENSHLLQPPINNFCVYSDPMTVMVVGGPNARTDYHINTTPEFFYQYKGRMLLKTVQNGNEFKDVYIDEGEMFLLPGNTPHNPVRFADTVGIVVEQPRPADSVDKLRWYCQGCGEVVKEAAFHCTDLGTQIKQAVEEFGADLEARKCGKCGEVCETRPSTEVMEQMRLGGREWEGGRSSS